MVRTRPDREVGPDAGVVGRPQGGIRGIGRGEAHAAGPHLDLGRDPDVVDAAVEAMWGQYQQPFFWASLELWLASRHNAEVARTLSPNERRLNRLIRSTVDSFFGKDLAERAAYDDTVHLLLSSMRGVGLTYALTPTRNPRRDPHLRIWKDLARRLLQEGV